MPKKIIYLLILFISVGVSIIFFIKVISDKLFIDNEINSLNIKTLPDESTNYEEEINKLKYTYQNDDIVGILKIDSLSIDSIITKHSDNEYYLNHDIYKNNSSLGNPFLDYRVDINNSKQINIYGHNSHHYDIPFAKLDAYLDESFYFNNKYINLITNEYSLTYEIFAVYGIFNNDNEHMHVYFNNDTQWLEHINTMKDKSIYNTNTQLSKEDKILTLQTCLFNSSYGNYLIINAKQV